MLDDGVMTGVCLVVIERILHRALLVLPRLAFPGSFVTAGHLGFANGIPGIIGAVPSFSGLRLHFNGPRGIDLTACDQKHRRQRAREWKNLFVHKSAGIHPRSLAIKHRPSSSMKNGGVLIWRQDFARTG